MKTIWAALRDVGVLGINRRNIDFISAKNPRHLYPRVDDKMLTKKLCRDANIPVPELISSAEHAFALKQLIRVLANQEDFVVKPARGAMGNGTLVVSRVEESSSGLDFVLAGGKRLSEAEMLYHCSGVIAGLYSLGGQSDTVMVEERLRPHAELLAHCSDGVPDVRVIVYCGVPVMCMIRLPTATSGGRANLHQGAVGVGVAIDSGQTCHAVWKNLPITLHPDDQAPLLGWTIPDFERVLEIAVRAADQSGLGYVGADVVIDARRGPVILELNARPGLAIQLANRAGLLPRLREIDAHMQREGPNLHPSMKFSISERVLMGQDITRDMQNRTVP